MVQFETSAEVTVTVVNPSATATIPAYRAVVLEAESGLTAAQLALTERHGAKMPAVALSGADGEVYGVTSRAIPPEGTGKLVIKGLVKIEATSGADPAAGVFIESDGSGKARNSGGRDGTNNVKIFGRTVTAPADDPARYGAQGADFGTPIKFVYANIDCAGTLGAVDVSNP